MLKVKNPTLLILAFSMSLIVVSSNYLVQFPVNYFQLENLLTYGAFTYPIAFLVTDLANRKYGKKIARKIVYLGFILGIILTLYFSTDFSNLISKRIAIGSGSAFLFAQLVDVQVFDKLKRRVWFIAPLVSSLIGSCIDTFLFFSIAFYGTGISWVTLAIGDLFVKILFALIMLLPFRVLVLKMQEDEISEKKISV
mgnify:CR=1 FL=1